MPRICCGRELPLSWARSPVRVTFPEILHQCFRLPNGEEEGTWFTCKQVSEALMKVYPSMKRGNATNIRIGQTLKYLGCQMKHTYKGAAYKLVEVAA